MYLAKPCILQSLGMLLKRIRPERFFERIPFPGNFQLGISLGALEIEMPLVQTAMLQLI